MVRELVVYVYDICDDVYICYSYIVYIYICRFHHVSANIMKESLSSSSPEQLDDLFGGRRQHQLLEGISPEFDGRSLGDQDLPMVAPRGLGEWKIMEGMDVH